MLREEAEKLLRREIECLSHTKCSDCILEKACDPAITTHLDSEYIEAYEMAIKALEQEPCEDATLKDIFCMGCEYKEQEPCEDVVALEFSADIDKPSKYQTKDGKWHDGKIPSVTPKQKVPENPTGSTCSEKPNNCEDAISRQAAQDYIAKYLSQTLYPDVRAAVEVIDEYIGELPSVTPKQSDVLDNIRADIINIADGKQSIKVRSVLRNIDKHKAEIEPQESEGKE